MRVILQDRRDVVRTALPAMFAQFDIDIIGAVSTAAGLRRMCAQQSPDGVVIEVDGVPWDATRLCDDLRDAHPHLRIIGVGCMTTAVVDDRVTPDVDLASLAEALHGRTRPAAMSSVPALSLTTRQAEVLSLVSQGRSAEQIAVALRVSTSTVAYHKREIFTRLGVQSQAQAVRTAMRHGLLQPTAS